MWRARGVSIPAMRGGLRTVSGGGPAEPATVSLGGIKAPLHK